MFDLILTNKICVAIKVLFCFASNFFAENFIFCIEMALAAKTKLPCKNSEYFNI